MVNKDGKTVAPTVGSLPGRRRQCRLEVAPGYGVILANQPGDESWPMTAATLILIHKQPQDPAAAAEALKFFAWAYAKGGKMAEELDYVPMPAKVVAGHREDLGEPRSRTRAASRSSRRLELSRRNDGKGADAAPFLASPFARQTACAAASQAA